MPRTTVSIYPLVPAESLDFALAAVRARGPDMLARTRGWVEIKRNTNNGWW